MIHIYCYSTNRCFLFFKVIIYMHISLETPPPFPILFNTFFNSLLFLLSDCVGLTIKTIRVNVDKPPPSGTNPVGILQRFLEVHHTLKLPSISRMILENQVGHFLGYL